MKKQFIIITYTSVVLGMFALFSALTQEYSKNSHDHNVQRLIDQGVRVEAVVIDKKKVKTEYKGTYSMPKESVEFRVYIKVTKPLPQQGKVVWQAAQPEVYEATEIGSTVHAYLKQNDVFIEELTVEKKQSKVFLIAALGLLCVAILANMKANQYARQNVNDTTKSLK